MDGRVPSRLLRLLPLQYIEFDKGVGRGEVELSGNEGVDSSAKTKTTFEAVETIGVSVLVAGWGLVVTSFPSPVVG